jgi:hypothetical protein
MRLEKCTNIWHLEAGDVLFATFKPILYKLIRARKTRTAPPSREIYVIVF